MNDKIIDILGTKYNIKYVDKIPMPNEHTYRFGQENSADHIIEIATKFYSDSPISKEELDKNLIHECIHAILDEGQFFDESSNEPLVEWLARCIYSLKKQKVI